ncbi:rhophilin-2 isoform X2 [Hyposmocoma kahamanoa]|uniref:rhophilin-2 isoform X2 n=1 Tax=Hyposmocoma kahamanoa TaxID=1477025 RepID=UPI000E6D8314|nr:rhophilin-2 isoform X2 [Hyposmocoma kahamanoa]XP_026316517.1 rhophilin-2 isoform X2 [Hyposmocoma kahamanoa]XP_026316518.1 rhophilin-2 isoform X2 [Hyposmocoma kahamanoa]XP_026316519.1 rhophilin-2 isoform X2 [Hyposmocoma kahamanoa]XP_026316520.1 rhophilin-2 isoform X2 [Hyposmocoma kahamanoa]
MMKMASVLMGSDPRVATCRGRLQTRRCQLNQEINKELRLRAGAENLFKATTNRKLRETVALELSFVNSNLQLLKEQLAELNSSVELYQSDSKEAVMPMIPLGLKETKEVDFREPFKDFVLEHYSEDAATYEDAISDFMDMRQAIRTPVRSTAGVALLFKYYNQLYFIERRFFPPDRSLGVYFEWFDSLTGVPSCQRTVAFEKACVLFNIAGIYTQIGAKQERSTCAGLDGAVDALLRAAGTLRYIHENFTNAPSVDLAADTLLVLGALMTAQARECLFEKLQLQARDACGGREHELRDDLDMCLDLAQESAQLAHVYRQLYEKMQSEGVFNYVPYSWVSLVHVKTEFYKALAHQYCATGLLHASSAARVKDRLASLYALGGDRNVDNGLAGTATLKEQELDPAVLGRAHLAEALALYEEALRLQRMCRELRDKEPLAAVVRAHAARAARDRAARGDEPDFMDLLDAPAVQPSSKFQLALTPPDFAQHRVEDLFKSLGPIAIFSAKRHWSAPRLIQLQKHTDKKRDNSRKDKRNGRIEEYTELKRTEKRDRSEDNSTYYNQILRNDESMDDYEKKKLHRVMKQNGVYINSYNNNNNYDYHPKVIDYYNGNENGYEYMNGKKNGRKKDPLRRASSEYNVSAKTDDGFGFSVRGDAPVVIAAVEPNSLADIGGMREGDFIISIGDRDAKWASHDEVVRLIQQAGDTLTLRLATPMDKSCAKPSPDTPRQTSSNQGSVSAASTASSGSTAITASRSARRAPSWNPFRRHSSRDNSSHRGSHTSNVIFR